MKIVFKRIEEYFSDDLNKYKFWALVLFTFIITAFAWQSDDAYHAYAMSKNLVDGHGFVYNIGERSSASSCPLFTLIVALGYLVFRNMFLVSLLICVIFSSWAFGILLHSFCESEKQVIISFLLCICSVSFMSYTTAGLENCLLFLLAALFLKKYYYTESYKSWDLFYMAILISLIAMTRMDAVLLFAPMAVYLYLVKRNRVSFIKCCFIAAAGLLPFILWEFFSLFYFGFFVPNTAFVKLGTEIAKSEYIKRGIQYILITCIVDPLVILIPIAVILVALFIKKANYIFHELGILLYIAYVIYIGGDFMLGRHFTVLFFMSIVTLMNMYNENLSGDRHVFRNKKLVSFVKIVAVAGVVISIISAPISSQFLYGNNFNSPISDERGGYFKWTSLFNNAISYFRTGEMCIEEAWNDEGVQYLIDNGYDSGILPNVPGITKYYHNDMYLNDTYALGDPFISKLPAVKDPNWRIGHMYRECPFGYDDTIIYHEENGIENESLRQYYDVIKLITRGDLFDSNRIKAIIDINLGKYDHLIDEYKSTLDENNRQILTVETIENVDVYSE